MLLFIDQIKQMGFYTEPAIHSILLQQWSSSVMVILANYMYNYHNMYNYHIAKYFMDTI